MNPLAPGTELKNRKDLLEICNSLRKFVEQHDIWGSSFGDYPGIGLDSLFYGLTIKTIGNNKFLIILPLGKYRENLDFIVDHGYIVAAKFPHEERYTGGTFKFPWESYVLPEKDIQKLREVKILRVKPDRSLKYRLVGEGRLNCQFRTKFGKYRGFYFDKLIFKFSRYYPEFIY